jgi:hypothetical protein
MSAKYLLPVYKVAEIQLNIDGGGGVKYLLSRYGTSTPGKHSGLPAFPSILQDHNL